MPSAITAEALQEALPALDGTLRLAGLQAPAEVYRDAAGIPHIRTQSVADAWFALGAVHAQDRLFQMDLTRRRALGRAAEWLGASAAESDTLVRRLGMEAACRRDYAALGAEARSMLDRYADGVNAQIASGQPLPIEYNLLEARPEAWEGWHSIAVMRRLGLLMGSVWFKLWRAVALPVVGPGPAMTLRYDDGGRDLLCIPPGVEAERWQADLAAMAPAVEGLLAALAPEMAGDETGGGSNNWAVGPERSSTGRPVLAGDPHRVFEIPNMYAQHHLACAEFDMIGLTVPGVPGFPHFAQNGRVAYCVTHAFMDIHDLFLEQLDEAGTSTRFGEAWEPLARRSESIAIRGAAPRSFEVLESRHGPLIAGAPGSRHALALRSVQFAETDLSFDCLPRMTRANSVAELFEATRGWGLIDHNLVAGDTAGSIGHLVRAMVPRRPRENGWLPVPGWTGAHEWQGWIAHEAMPQVIDPPGGVIVTANNRVVDDAHPDYLCTDCHPPYRARRIAERLAALPAFGPEHAAAIHGDTLSANALLFREKLAALPEPAEPAAAALRARLLAWDGRMAAGASEPSAYVALRRALTHILAERSGLAGLGQSPWVAVPPGVVPQNQLWWALPHLLRQDDVRMLNGWNWDQALSASLAEAVSVPEQPWGEAHQPRFSHPLSPLFPELAGLLDPASQPVGGDNDTVLANGLLCSAGPAATYGALSRYVFDVGNWDASRWVVFHGASGRPGSPFYANQQPAWAASEMLPMIYGWDAISASSLHRQDLLP